MSMCRRGGAGDGVVVLFPTRRMVTVAAAEMVRTWWWRVAVAAVVRTKRCSGVDGGCRDWCVTDNGGSWWSETAATAVEVDGGG